MILALLPNSSTPRAGAQVPGGHHRGATQEHLDQVANLQIDLGPIKGNGGNQNYIIEDPAFNPENFTNGSVVLYSMPYETIFSYASLRQPAAGP